MCYYPVKTARVLICINDKNTLETIKGRVSEECQGN
jgi:hypothetical protein